MFLFNSKINLYHILIMVISKNVLWVNKLSGISDQ